MYGPDASNDVAIALGQRRCIHDPLDSFKLRHLERDVIVAPENSSMPTNRNRRKSLHLVWPKWENGFGDFIMSTLLPLGCELHRTGLRGMDTLGLSGVGYAKAIAPLQHKLRSVCTLERSTYGLVRCEQACYEEIHICELGTARPIAKRQTSQGARYESWRSCTHNPVLRRAAWRGMAALDTTYDAFPNANETALVGERGVLRVVIARRAGRRFITNLDDLLRHCERASGSAGWEGWRLQCTAPVLGGLSPEMLVRTLRAADVLVAMHGGDVINGLHMMPGRTVIELLNYDFRNARHDWKNQHQDMLQPALRFRRILVLPLPRSARTPPLDNTNKGRMKVAGTVDWGNPLIFKAVQGAWNQNAVLPWEELERELKQVLSQVIGNASRPGDEFCRWHPWNFACTVRGIVHHVHGH